MSWRHLRIEGGMDCVVSRLDLRGVLPSPLVCLNVDGPTGRLSCYIPGDRIILSRHATDEGIHVHQALHLNRLKSSQVHMQWMGSLVCCSLVLLQSDVSR